MKVSYEDLRIRRGVRVYAKPLTRETVESLGRRSRDVVLNQAGLKPTIKQSLVPCT